MASKGISDRVAVVGMGCTRFAEHWHRDADDLIIDAAEECFAATPEMRREDVDAFWVGTLGSGLSGLTLSKPLKLQNKPVTRVENYCASGSESFRAACYAVASGAYDRVMAFGVEKIKDLPYSGLVVPGPPTDGTNPKLTAPAGFSLLVPAYAARYGVSVEDIKHAMTRIAWKNHANGALNPRAQFQKEVSLEKIAAAPKIAGELGIFDCSGISDGAACAIIVPAEEAHKYTDTPMYVKGLSVAAGTATPGGGPINPDFDYTSFVEVVVSAADAYRQAGITDPAKQISLAEVHDCFTPTEMVLMEDLGFSERGAAWSDVLAGKFDLGGALPVNPDGGLKSFGHPIGASGLRMLFEIWLQFRGEAGDRQLPDPKIGLTQNLGGRPGACVSFVSVVGKEPST